jgi:hypothetical protein
MREQREDAASPSDAARNCGAGLAAPVWWSPAAAMGSRPEWQEFAETRQSRMIAFAIADLHSL